MINYLKSNWKDIISAMAGLVLLVLFVNYATNFKAAVGADGQPVNPGWWPIFLDIGSAIVHGTARFAFVLFLGWAGLKITLPEGAAFVFGDEFDTWWNEASKQVKAIVSLSGAAVLLVIAAICFVSAVG